MAELFPILVFFNCDRLQGKDRFSVGARSSILNEEIAKIRTEFPGVNFVKLIPTACAVEVAAPSDAFQDFVVYLDKCHIGYEFVGPMIRAARNE